MARLEFHPTLAAPDDDPWLWLEEVEGPRARDWVARQNAATLARFADARFEADRDAVKAALDRPDKLPMVTRRGAWLFNFWQDAAHPRGLWRRTTLDSYRSAAPEWDTVLDLDALARAEGEDWVWQGAATLPGTHDRAMVYVSRGGSDAAVLREFDVEARCFVGDGFRAPEAKGGIEWVDRDTLLLSSTLGEGMTTHAGLARTVRLWRRGTCPESAPVIFEVDFASMQAWGSVDRAASGRLVFLERIRFFDQAIHLGDAGGPRQRLDIPADAECSWCAEWLAIRPRSPWTLGSARHEADTLLGIGLQAFLDGDRAFQVLARPHPRRSLRGFFWCAGRLVVSELDELRPVFRMLTPGPAAWREAALPGTPAAGVAALWPLDAEREESDGTLLLSAEDPVTPPQLLETSTALPMPRVLRSSTPMFDAQGLVVTRHEAVSVDGERIPYAQTGPAGAETGEAPVHLYGYGGFRIPQLPTYRGILGKLWLERGGTGVVANIRGGGEFGTRWHQAAIRERKHLAHEDFAAVAADLVRRGVTRPGRIAAEGGSNGGLLIANMLTRFPDRFGALFCTIPLVDMRRFHRLLIGASWIAEFGNPDVPEDWAFLQRISAYHLAEPGRRYPPILLATSRRD
ncbi:MAG TPA: prolyl oligopeptidase family serine peptidase, partial [Acetobacteraceae bacterium]|nr:prolyl oligopeptidase family serine peptidase [Acetobacteraceae bacterium]